MRRAIAGVRPDLAGAPVVVHDSGWDCVAAEAGGVIFKFPRTEAARRRLAGEPASLAFYASLVDLTVPSMTLHEGKVWFSQHDKIAGETIDPSRYEAMREVERDRLADDLAAAYCAVHAADPALASSRGIGPVAPWPGPDRLFAAVTPHLDSALLALVAEAIGRVAAVGSDCAVFGQFDTHGWNMAYDLDRGRLIGLFDFGDAGIGPRHKDLSYPSFVSPDLTARIVQRYERAGGAAVDVDHVFDLHTVLRLIEIANAAGREAHFAWALTDWLAARARVDSRVGPAAGLLPRVAPQGGGAVP